MVINEDIHLPRHCKPVITGIFHRFLSDYSFANGQMRFGFAVWFINRDTGETNTIETYHRPDGTVAVVSWTPDCAEESDAIVLGTLTHLEHDCEGLYLTFEKDGKHFRVDSEAEYGDYLTVCEEFDPEVLA